MEQTGGKRKKGSEREDADEGKEETIGKGEQEQDGRGKNANL